MNRLVMKGNLVKENNFKVSDKGNAFLINSIAVTEGKDKKRTDYFNIIAFGEVAEQIANGFKKGSEISFEGKLQNNNYELNGQKVYRDQIIVERIVQEVTKKNVAELLYGSKELDKDVELPF